MFEMFIRRRPMILWHKGAGNGARGFVKNRVAGEIYWSAERINKMLISRLHYEQKFGVKLNFAYAVCGSGGYNSAEDTGNTARGGGYWLQGKVQHGCVCGDGERVVNYNNSNNGK